MGQAASIRLTAGDTERLRTPLTSQMQLLLLLLLLLLWQVRAVEVRGVQGHVMWCMWCMRPISLPNYHALHRSYTACVVFSARGAQGPIRAGAAAVAAAHTTVYGSGPAPRQAGPTVPMSQMASSEVELDGGWLGRESSARGRWRLCFICTGPGWGLRWMCGGWVCSSGQLVGGWWMGGAGGWVRGVGRGRGRGGNVLKVGCQVCQAGTACA